MKLNRFFYLIKEGIKSIFTHGFMSFASVTTIVACLIIMGCFSLLAVNVDAAITQLEQDNEIVAFVDDSGYAASPAGEEAYLNDALELKVRLEALDNVREAVFTDRYTAYESFVAGYDDETMFSDLDNSVLRHRYVIHLDDIALMENTVEAIEGVRGIAKVRAHMEVSRGFIIARNVVSAISLGLIAILFIISVFIMANTIKLATFGRKEEIAIMKMVGASNFFIRCPFVIEGLLLGLLGGAIAFFAQWGIYDLLQSQLGGSLGEFVQLIAFERLRWPLLSVFAATGLVVGVFGSNIAIRNYLKV